MIVREARPDEAPTLSDLARRAKASWGYPEEWLRAWAPQLRFTDRSFDDWRIFVAEDDGRILGVVALAVSGAAAEGEIEHLWVDPEAHGRGIGRSLVETALRTAELAGATSVRVESDPGARPFYERLGARYQGEVAAPVLGVARTLPVLRFAVEGRVLPDGDGRPHGAPDSHSEEPA